MSYDDEIFVSTKMGKDYIDTQLMAVGCSIIAILVTINLKMIGIAIFQNAPDDYEHLGKYEKFNTYITHYGVP